MDRYEATAASRGVQVPMYHRPDPFQPRICPIGLSIVDTTELLADLGVPDAACPLAWYHTGTKSLVGCEREAALLHAGASGAEGVTESTWMGSNLSGVEIKVHETGVSGLVSATARFANPGNSIHGHFAAMSYCSPPQRAAARGSRWGRNAFAGHPCAALSQAAPAQEAEKAPWDKLGAASSTHNTLFDSSAQRHTGSDWADWASDPKLASYSPFTAQPASSAASPRLYDIFVPTADMQASAAALRRKSTEVDAWRTPRQPLSIRPPRTLSIKAQNPVTKGGTLVAHPLAAEDMPNTDDELSTAAVPFEQVARARHPKTALDDKGPAGAFVSRSATIRSAYWLGPGSDEEGLGSRSPSWGRVLDARPT